MAQAASAKSLERGFGTGEENPGEVAGGLSLLHNLYGREGEESGTRRKGTIRGEEEGNEIPLGGGGDQAILGKKTSR